MHRVRVRISEGAGQEVGLLAENRAWHLIGHKAGLRHGDVAED